ncbi:TOBE domain-containing protein [Azospirillum sp. ST 5-10]|uniref:TOBE domain-containing protein n=1 Tax=unclassified Azospirillum TaxID=2630922 RepID=UPI003F4A3C1D
MPVEASVALRGDGGSPVGRERIRLLEAVGRQGSISAAARTVGLTYKAAWDAIDAMNNLFGRPLVGTRAGGRKGGGAVLTAEGVRVVETFHRLEAELARTLKALEPQLDGTGISATNLMWGFLMRTSARNALRGTVTAVAEDAVNAEVSLAISGTTTLHAVITRDGARTLGLVPGREAVALIKSSFVLLAPAGEVGRVSARNQIAGTVCRREEGGVNTEIVLDIGGGKTLTAVITAHSAAELDLRVGARACALVKASDVLLAVD